MDEPCIELLESEDGIIGDQRGIRLDAFIGDVEAGQEPFGQSIERAYLVSPLNFARNLATTDVPRFALKQGNFVEPWCVFSQEREGVDLCWLKMVA